MSAVRPLPIASTSLAERILDCFPSGTYAMAGLLRLLDIVETREVPTAAVECRLKPRLRINPDFVAVHAHTPEKLLMLVMHELHHVLLGHTTLFPQQTPADNLVFDAVINGVICRMFPGPAYTSLLTDYYEEDRFPQCLLRPPPGWHPDGTRVQGVASGIARLSPMKARRAAALHAALYSPAGASYDEVRSLLKALLKDREVGKVRLLGDHGSEGERSADGDLETRAPVLLDVVRDIVEQWPQPPDPIRGRSLSDVLRTRRVTVERHRSYRLQLQRLIERVAIAGKGAGRRRVEGTITVDGALPGAQRRTLVLRSLGHTPLLHPTPVRWARQNQSLERVHIYVDVSGSMDEWIPRLYGAVVGVRHLVAPKIHLFSTQIVDVPWTTVRDASVPSTGGTDIRCVVEHLLKHHIRRAVILTDGATGRPDASDLPQLQRLCIGVALTQGDSRYHDLEAVSTHTHLLKDPHHV